MISNMHIIIIIFENSKIYELKIPSLGHILNLQLKKHFVTSKLLKGKPVKNHR